jgi:hypothetical protein
MSSGAGVAGREDMSNRDAGLRARAEMGVRMGAGVGMGRA